MSALFLKPLDVLYLRGNRLFGGAGDDSSAQMPPWPSVAAGAIRSRMLVDHGVSPAEFAGGTMIRDVRLADCLGMPQEPGAFRVARFTMARQLSDGAIEPLLPLPADRVALGRAESFALHALQPAKLPEGVSGSMPDECRAVPRLRMGQAAKPVSGLWLNGEGIARWLRDKPPSSADVMSGDALWRVDHRLGIAMDADLRTAAEGRIYTSETVALREGIGLLAEIEGADGLMPQSGLIRLGGDGRGAEIESARVEWPEPDWEAIGQSGRFRVLLTSPGLFPEGWRPSIEGARLVAAAVNRAEVVSGWDLAAHAPKPAQRFAPAGSVYWFEDFGGDIAALQALVRDGLPGEDKARRAEGFNACLIGNWHKESNDV